MILDSSVISAIFFREEKSEAVENEVRDYDKLLTIRIIVRLYTLSLIWQLIDSFD
ncbi:MAG: hypothetical protein ACP6IU_12690 [Candidatus Asgardarchaeia archaeon]